MTGLVALALAIIWIVCAAWRLTPAAPRVLRTVQLILALVAGAAGLLHWSAVGDSRWLVGGILLIGSALPGWWASAPRSARIAALVVGLLGTGLYAIATANPPAARMPVPETAQG